jgi:hypothetical protein
MKKQVASFANGIKKNYVQNVAYCIFVLFCLIFFFEKNIKKKPNTTNKCTAATYLQVKLTKSTKKESSANNTWCGTLKLHGAQLGLHLLAILGESPTSADGEHNGNNDRC